MISEEAKTFFYYNSSNTTRSSGKKFRHDVADGKEVVWMSERDGWNHLYLYDGATGKVKNQITKGDWVVRSVEKVDDEKRQIWFSAGGMTPGKDPYFLHYYRINFDGTGLTPLTTADADHTVKFSPDMQYYVDTYSRVDLADVMELRKASDGSLVKELERGDITELKAAGWKPPEVVRRQGPRRQDRHLGRDRPPDELRSGEEVSGASKASTPARRARSCRRPSRRYSGTPGAGRARLHRRADRRHGHVEPLEGVPRRRVART